MKTNFCTLFNSRYLTRGLAMYFSLLKNCPSFHLYVYAFDDISFLALKELSLDHMTVIPLEDLEDNELLEVKSSRSFTEYCWTCTPCVIKHSIEFYKLAECTYVDADLYFFKDPSILLNENSSRSILITKHNYSPQYDQSNKSGIYCVQFMTFCNNPDGMIALNWWKDACIDWCFNKYEDGKFGDQKYLDDWPTRFKGVHVLENVGSLAPWNIQKFTGDSVNDKIVFYHFHGLKFLLPDRIDLGGYKLSQDVIKTIYYPYIQHLQKLNNKLSEQFTDYSFDMQFTVEDIGVKRFLSRIKLSLLGTNNIYRSSAFNGSSN